MTTPKFPITTGLTPIEIHFSYENSLGTGIDLSGCTANFQVRSPSNKLLLDITDSELYVGYDQTSGFNFTTDSPTLKNGQIKLNSDKDGNIGQNGGVYIAISSDALDKVRGGRNTYTLQITDPNGNITQLLDGSFGRRNRGNNRRSIEKLRVGENFIDQIRIRPEQTKSDADTPVNNDVTFRFTSDVSGSNANLSICDYPVPNPARTKYIHPSGNDTTGDGSKTKPFKTVKKAVNEFTNSNVEDCYVVFLEGIYSIDTLGAGNHAWTRTSGGSTSLMTTIGLNDSNYNVRKVTLMSEKPLKAILLGSIVPTFLGSTGASSDVRIFDISGPTFIQAGVTFIRKYINGKNATEIGLFRGPTGFNSVNFTEIPYPIMLNGGITQNKEKWASQVNLWTGVTSATAGFTGFVYEEASVSAGVTGYYISGPEIWNIVSSFGTGFSWSDTALALHGGNNNVHTATILDVNHATQKIRVTSNPPSPFNPSSYGTDAFAFLGNPGFTMTDLSFAYKDNKVYFRGITYNTLRINAVSTGMITNNCTELTICGFEMGEFKDDCITNYATGSTTNSNRKSLVVKYCLLRDTVSGGGIASGNHFNTKIFGNFIANTNYRPISIGSPRPTSPNTSCGSGLELCSLYPLEPYYPGYEGIEVSYNTCYNWKTYTGIYGQDARNVLISNNNLYNLASAHGNGIALYSGSGITSFYSGCKNVVIRKNFIYTPNNITLAINNKNINTDPWLIENNVFLGSFQYRDAFNLNGLIFTNNFGGVGHYSIYPKTDTWWFAYKNIYRYNAFGIDGLWDFDLFGGAGSTFNVGITGYLNRTTSFGLTYMPQGFSGERLALASATAGTSAAAKAIYNPWKWIQTDKGQTLPNMWTNLFFQRMDYDRFVEFNGQSTAQQPIIFPYTETRTLRFSNQIVAAQDSTTRTALKVAAVRDYYGNDFRLKSGITGSTFGIGVNWKSPTANIANISTWWLFGLTLCSNVPTIENDFSDVISADRTDDFNIPSPASEPETVPDPEDTTDYGYDYRINNNQNTPNLVELTYKDYISTATSSGVLGIYEGYTAEA